MVSEARKILVVGATGFVGPALVDEFVRAGYRVVCGVRNMARAAKQLNFPGVEFMEVDLNCDLSPELWLSRLRDYEIDGVVNNVGIANSFGGQSLENVNMRAPLALCQAVMSRNQERAPLDLSAGFPPERDAGIGELPIIQISTTGVDWPDCDHYEYPRTKKQIDLALAEMTGLNFIIVRPNIIYEPERGHLILEQLARLPVIGYVGGADIQPINCRELAIGIARLMQNPFPARHTIIQATGPEVMSWKAVFSAANRALNRKNCIFIPIPLLLAQVFTNLISLLPGSVLKQIGILSKIDNDTIVMMTKGSIGSNEAWLKYTHLYPIKAYDAYRAYGQGTAAYLAYIDAIRTGQGQSESDAQAIVS